MMNQRWRSCSGLSMMTMLMVMIFSVLVVVVVEGNIRISGGKDANKHQYPFYGGLTIPGIDKIICSGFFYREDIFISLANCQGNKFKESDLVVYAGSNDRRCSESTCAIFNVQKTLTHPAYSAKTLDNDIGIYLLKQNTSQFNDHDLKVSTIDIIDSIPENLSTNYQIMGWGRLNISSPSSYMLQTIEQQFVDNGECVKADTNGKFDTEKMKCVKRTSQGACLGDGGGPLCLIESNKTSTVVAFFSFSLGDTDKICDQDTYHAYLNLPKYKRWIDSSITTLRNTSTCHFSLSTLLIITVFVSWFGCWIIGSYE